MAETEAIRLAAGFAAIFYFIGTGMMVLNAMDESRWRQLRGRDVAMCLYWPIVYSARLGLGIVRAVLRGW